MRASTLKQNIRLLRAISSGASRLTEIRGKLHADSVAPIRHRCQRLEVDGLLASILVREDRLSMWSRFGKSRPAVRLFTLTDEGRDFLERHSDESTV